MLIEFYEGFKSEVEKLKVAFVTPEFVTEVNFFDGGLSNYLLRVSLALIKLGHQPVILVSSDKTEIVQYKAIQVHRVNVFNKTYSLLSNCSSWTYQSLILNLYLDTLIQKQPIDIIQYTNYTSPGLYRINRMPSVTRISSYYPLLAEYYEMEPSEDLNKRIQLESICLNNSDAVFGPSRKEAGYIKYHENIDVEIIESPFINDVEEYDYSLYKKYLGDKKYLLYFGTLCVLKGLITISQIIKDLLKFNKDLFFVFIGKDLGYRSRKIIDILYEMAGEYSSRILYFDRISHDMLYPIIENSYSVVLPSRIDNFPNSCIEAMAHSKIVVGTQDTGFEQLIEHKVNGFLCKRDNPEELNNILNEIIRMDEESRKRIEGNALKRIELLEPDIVVKKLLDFYQRTIDRVNSKPLIDSYDFGKALNLELIDLVEQQTKINQPVKKTILQKILSKVKRYINRGIKS